MLPWQRKAKAKKVRKYWKLATFKNQKDWLKSKRLTWFEPLGNHGRDPVIATQWLWASHVVHQSKYPLRKNEGRDPMTDRYYAITPIFLHMIALFMGMHLNTFRKGIFRGLTSALRTTRHTFSIWSNWGVQQHEKATVYWAVRTLVAEGLIAKEIAQIGRLFKADSITTSYPRYVQDLSSWRDRVRPTDREPFPFGCD